MKNQTRAKNNNLAKSLYERILQFLPESQKRSLKRIVSGNTSEWLTTITNEADHKDLSANQFRDALQNLPSKYNGCDSQMNLTHALNCKK